ncbi:Clp protease N-terminal domain-containing protein [Streptomyces sp. NPDC059900]|uniref:Clp protease N-terminal domain-containing protein n=1 Tax=Streptomyces sp. NPDC059900 TaxID=3155816 RepID=UPI00344002B8
MQSRTPQGAEPGPIRAETDACLNDLLASAVAGARRRAMRDGDRQIDTAHLLHSLLETDPDVRAALDDGEQVVRLLGYLVQRSIGYGLQWQGTVEDSGAMPLLRPGNSGSGKETGWSPSAAAAMEAAVERAARRGEQRALGIDLLAALVADPDCRAVEVLRRAGADAQVIVRRLREDPLTGTSAEAFSRASAGSSAEPYAGPFADPRAGTSVDPYAEASAD